MSIFVPIPLSCPACRESGDFLVVQSVNADRRPDLRQAILDGAFQRETCAKCGAEFRLEPQFTYFDGGRRQWILIQQAFKLDQWATLEKAARATYERTYGQHASAQAQAVGGELVVRVVFGWPALREKLLCVEHGLDDVVLEMLKTMLLRNADEPPISDDVELRLVEVSGPQLTLAWVDAATEGMFQTLQVPRSLYDDVAADQANWGTLPEELSAGAFVDMQRLFVGVE